LPAPAGYSGAPMQCVILAGGLATRMRPITETIPKALIPVAGVPFIEHQLRWMATHGVTRAVLSIGYRGVMLADHVGDGARFGLEVRVVDEGATLRGTAGALRLALDQGALDPEFLVTYGDSFLPIDFAAVWRAFGESGAPALMTVFRNAGRWDSSNAIYREGRVVLYDKHHQTRPAADFDFIDYGLLAMKRSVIADGVPAPRAPGDKADLAELFHALSRAGRLAGLEITQRFYEIGSPEGLEDFEAWMHARP
jgi:NDP-sugar pyrophosphorylase family protein